MILCPNDFQIYHDLFVFDKHKLYEVGRLLIETNNNMLIEVWLQTEIFDDRNP